jgi:kynureninase
VPEDDVRLPREFVELAAELDERDPLAAFRSAFVLPEGVLAYLDGNSLGRPLKVTRERLAGFVDREWGERLIRAWDEQWLDRPTAVGDLVGRAVLGAAPRQTVVGDSTTVMLYKLVRAAVDARPGRPEIIADTENFPTDRFILASVAAETGRTVRWIEPDPATGVRPAEVEALLSDRTALVVLSHVAYKSAYIADLPGITASAHRAGALVLWDLCHSVGVVPVELDAWGVDLAVGCSYKYLNGGPGAPAWIYVRREHQHLGQPIQGWLGSEDPFGMGQGYRPAAGIRRFASGTPPIIGMTAIADMIALIGEAGIGAIREKSKMLTQFALEVTDALLAPHGVVLASPRNPAERGSHLTIDHPAFRQVTARLWDRGVIPDYRNPNGLRLGLSPLSTGFEEVYRGVSAIAEELAGD